MDETKPKTVISFRPSDDVLARLIKLTERWDCTRTAALERSVEIAHGGHFPKHDKPIGKPKPKPTGKGFIKNPVMDHEKLMEFQRKTGVSTGRKTRNE